jgi:AcrR family transcriptional regulator
MSIGSLYQYFSNKEAVAEALAARYEEGLRAVTDDVVHAEVIGLPTAEAVDRLVDPFLEFYDANPAFRALWLGSDVSKRLQRSVEGMDKEAMSRVLGLIEIMIPTMPKRRSVMVAMVMHGAVKSLLTFHGRDATDAQRRMAAREVKRMLSDYFLSLMAEYREDETDNTS